MASILTLTTVGAVNALRADAARVSRNYSLSLTSDEIVMTSERLDDLEVHATVTFTVRRGGYMQLKVEAHNTARRRKFLNADGALLTGGLRFELDRNYREKIDDGEWVTWYMNGYDWDLEQEWDRVVNSRDLTASLSIDAFRIQGV